MGTLPSNGCIVLCSVSLPTLAYCVQMDWADVLETRTKFHMSQRLRDYSLLNQLNMVKKTESRECRVIGFMSVSSQSIISCAWLHCSFFILDLGSLFHCPAGLCIIIWCSTVSVEHWHCSVESFSQFSLTRCNLTLSQRMGLVTDWSLACWIK